MKMDCMIIYKQNYYATRGNVLVFAISTEETSTELEFKLPIDALLSEWILIILEWKEVFQVVDV